MTEAPLTRRTLPEIVENIADRLEDLRPFLIVEDAEVTLAGLILSLRVAADLERKGL